MYYRLSNLTRVRAHVTYLLFLSKIICYIFLRRFDVHFKQHISIFSELEHSLLCLEASYATVEDIRDIILGRLEAFVSIAHGIRTMGSAALTLCHVAMGAVEGYHSDNLMPWDVAAGVLIIREAGGMVINTNGISYIL